MEGRIFHCIEAKQPIGTMYVCVLDYKFLQKITEANIRRKDDECRDVEQYVGIQRQLDEKRKVEIGKYVNLSDASFPNSIILTISSDDVEYDDEKKEITIKDEKNIASVLDGQHRLAGLDYFKGEKFDCIVSIFIDMEMEDQAVIFTTINTEQKKVNKSLVSDLYELYQTRNPQRTCHNVSRLLNTIDESPFKGKISSLGAADKTKGETLTQYIFVKELLAHISKTPLEDRDQMKKKDILGNHKKLSVKDVDSERTCLRKLFIEDESDTKIPQTIGNYFLAVSKKWPNSWEKVETNNILNKTTGYIALMKFFKDVYIKIGKDVPTVDEFYSVFSAIKLIDGTFTRDEYPTGGVGQSKLYKALKGISTEQ